MTEMVFPTYIFWCTVFGGFAGLLGGLIAVVFLKICEAKAQAEDQEDNENFWRKHGSIVKGLEHESLLKLPQEHDERSFLMQVQFSFIFLCRQLFLR